jgi:hypothetical protein
MMNQTSRSQRKTSGLPITARTSKSVFSALGKALPLNISPVAIVIADTVYGSG